MNGIQIAAVVCAGYVLFVVLLLRWLVVQGRNRARQERWVRWEEQLKGADVTLPTEAGD